MDKERFIAKIAKDFMGKGLSAEELMEAGREGYQRALNGAENQIGQYYVKIAVRNAIMAAIGDPGIEDEDADSGITIEEPTTKVRTRKPMPPFLRNLGYDLRTDEEKTSGSL